MRPVVPRIDAPDPSFGTAPPAFALTPALPGLGTEYLVMGLGAGMLGVYSLATGQLVAELFPGIPPRVWGDLWVRVPGDGGGGSRAAALPGFALGHFSGLALARVETGPPSAGNGAAGRASSYAGRMLLVAVPAGGQGAFVFELGLEAAVAAAADAAAAGGSSAAGRGGQQQRRGQTQQG
jgi:hypothetical protein